MASRGDCDVEEGVGGRERRVKVSLVTSPKSPRSETNPFPSVLEWFRALESSQTISGYEENRKAIRNKRRPFSNRKFELTR